MAAVRVLLVDDQDTYRRAMAMVIGETNGFEAVGEAASGEDAVVLAGRLGPDLVLMDVNLPGIDGLEATRQLLASPQPPLVLLLSTYDEDAGEQFVADSGAFAYVTKAAFGPVRLTELWSAARA